MSSAWEPKFTTPEQDRAIAEERRRLSRISTWRLCYTHDGGMFARNVEGTGAWADEMKAHIGKHVPGYGVLTYIGPPV